MAGPRHVWVDGRVLPADGPHLSVFDRGFQLGDGVFETLRARGGRPTELAEHVDAAARVGEPDSAIALPADVDRLIATGIADLLAAEDLAGPDGDASVRITVSRGPFRGRGLLPPDEDVGGHDRDPGLAGGAAAGRPPRARPAPRRIGGAPRPGEPARGAQDDVARGLRLRAPRGPAGRRRRRAVPHDRRLPVRGHDGEHLPRPSRADGAEELATPSLDCAILPGTTRSWLLGWGGRVGPAAGRGPADRADLAAADEAFLSSSVAGVLPVTRFAGEPIGDGLPGPWTRRARADREAMIRGGGSRR